MKNNKKAIGIVLTAIILISVFVAIAPTVSATEAGDLEAIRKTIEESGAEWQAGYTSVSGLSLEAKQRLCGLKIREPMTMKNTIESTSSVPCSRYDENVTNEKGNASISGETVETAKIEIPYEVPEIPKQAEIYTCTIVGEDTTFDWRDYLGGDWTTSIKDQGLCGSCWAFGSLAAMEAHINIQEDDPTFDQDLSEQQLLSCSPGDCDGWYEDAVLNWLRDEGTVDEACFPYQADDTIPCSDHCPNWESRIWQITDWGWVAPTPDAIKSSIRDAPLLTGMIIYEDFLYYDGGIYEHVSGDFLGYHLVSMVGYDEIEDYWICKNSWGTDWGEEGWFRIRYGQCDIENMNAYIEPPIIEPTTEQPDIWVDPTSFDVTLPPDTIQDYTMKIGNAGEATLTYYDIYDINDVETTSIASESTDVGTESSSSTTGQSEDCPWLDENPKSGSVPPGGYDEITVTIDTTGLECGEYSCDIIIANNDSDENPTTVPVSLTVSPCDGGWGVRLDVTCGAGTDVAEFGLNVDATDGFDPEFDVPEPPSPPPPYQQAYFHYPANPLVKKLSTSYIPPHPMGNSWPFRGDYSGDASDVTITWNAGDIAAVPQEDYSFFFVVDGEWINMRINTSYTFTATTGTYEFEIIAVTAVPYTFVLFTGWNMISFPVDPLDKNADTIFGPEYYYLCTRDPDTGCYVPVDAVETEIGYWILVLEDRNVTVLGTQLSEYNADLTQGWNMIGSLWTATNVPDGTETVPADQLYPYLYTWCKDHYELTQNIEPGLGYWALAYVDCELHVFPAPPAAPLPVQQIRWGDNDWHVRLALTSGAGADVAEFGLHEDATDDFSAEFDVPEPPSPPPSATSPYQQAYFYDPENPLVKKLSTSYIPHHFVNDDDEEYNSWLFRLDYSGDASDVTVTWNAEDINAVPAEYSLLFIADGEQIDMRTTPSYTFRAKTTRTYEFEIRALTGGKKPDLVIEEEYENHGGQAGSYTVFFVVKNIGTATAPGGHYATLYVDGVEKDKKLVPTDLEPGETYKGSFKTKVGLTGKVENIKVCADSYNDVDELDEDNNCLKGRWQPVAEKPPTVKPPTDKPPTDKPPKEKEAGLGD